MVPETTILRCSREAEITGWAVYRRWEEMGVTVVIPLGWGLDGFGLLRDQLVLSSASSCKACCLPLSLLV